MKAKIFSLLIGLLVLAVLTTPVFAGPGIGLSSVKFTLGSLIADGTLTGLGSTDVTVNLDASGIPDISCINKGGNTVPGQSSPKISASGQQTLPGNSDVRKNGRSPFGVETEDPLYLPWDQAGCPNAKWVGHIDFIHWTDATISVYDSTSGVLQLKRDYKCSTTRYPPSVTCTQVP